MPAFEHVIMPLSPPPVEEERVKLKPKGQFNYETRTGFILAVRFLCLDEKVRAVAVTLTKEAAQHGDKHRWLSRIMENAMTAIRLSADPEADLIHTGRGSISLLYQSDEPEPEFGVEITHTRNPDYRLDINRIVSTFGTVANPEMAPITALLAEGQMPSIPIHYRVLSLVRAFEKLYESKSEQYAVLDRFEDHFSSLNIGKRAFKNSLHDIRSRCAHGKGRGDEEPFVGIGYAEPTLHALLGLLQSIVALGLHEKYDMEFHNVRYIPGQPALTLPSINAD